MTPIEKALARKNREMQNTAYGLLLIAAVSLIIAFVLIETFAN